MKNANLTATLAALLCIGTVARADTTNYNFSVGLAIPDNDPNGLANRQVVSSAIVQITNITVSLTVSGGASGAWNGDYFAYLSHSSGYAVLLNRPGKTASNPFGYSDSGFNNVTFNDAATGDVHTYRYTLFGNDTTPLSGPLTGSWRPDGREIDPAFVVDTDPRTALLSSFRGLDPNGEWTLFLSDLSAGSDGVLVSWNLRVWGVVPEPSSHLLLLAGLPMLWWMLRRRKA
ncbi:MAG: PEP-CTERM sorting domain-containing protein [Verrucomicrobia bacterium]|nr:PEP-CTERM sorting domain-containing protein [Verrucomicrobiota bacterium]